MLFPNHPAYAEIRAGMGYQPGANALGDALHVRHLGYSAPYHGMGEVSEAQQQAAWDAGLDGPTIDALSAAGATDADIQALMAGDTDVATLMEKYAGLKSGEGTTVTTATPPSSASVPQVPSGSTLLYTATVTGGPGDLTVSPDSAMSQFAAALTAHGMTVTSPSNDETVVNKLFGTGSDIHFQFQILDMIGNAKLSDAKSVCDGVLQAIVGNNVTASNLSITSTPTGGAVQPQSQANPLAWLENNAVYIGLGIAGLILLSNFTGRRR